MSESDRDTEHFVALLRDAMRGQEHLADGGGARLLPAVRIGLTQQRGRSRSTWLGVAAAVVIAVGAVPATVALLNSGPETPRPPVSGPASSDSQAPIEQPPDGWRWESSLGLLALVPDTWTVNDYGCGQTDAPSVVRGYGWVTKCYTPEPSTKDLAIFELYGDDAPEEQVLTDALLDTQAPRLNELVDGLPAYRITAALPDGRSAGVMLVPDRGAALIVRTRNAETTQAILDSLRVVDIDPIGCPTIRPGKTASTYDGGTFVDRAPAGIALCYYGPKDVSEGWGMLLSSGELTGTEAEQLSELINAAQPGRNPDVPPDQCLPMRGQPDAVLYIRSGNGAVQQLWVSWSECVDRGLSNGVDEAHVTKSIVAAIMNPLRVGYHFGGDLPA